MAEHTPGPWRAVPQGGSSTVLSTVRPSRNDSRIPPFGYRDDGEHCIAYPFIEEDGSARFDFVCFSHEDARLIAAAPELLAALQHILAGALSLPRFAEDEARAAILKATGSKE